MADEIELLRLVSELIPEPTTDAWVRAKAAIDAAREEDLLCQETECFTSDPRPSARLTRRGARRRRRRLTLRWATAAAATLTAGAVALTVVVGAPGSHKKGTGQLAVTAAYVVERVDGALDRADPGQIAQMTVTTVAISSGTTTTTAAEEWSRGGQWRAVANLGGQPVYDEGFSTSSGYTLVNYPARAWARQPRPDHAAAPAPAPSGCEQAAAARSFLFGPGQPRIGSYGSSVSVARALRAAISCGTLTVAGYQRVDGIQALKLTSRRNSPLAETIWVSPGTYLPVRIAVHGQTVQITWLQLTAQNLSRLTVPIPAGFRQVSLADAVRSLPQIPGVPLPKGR
jgi:hypothetical protein